MKPLFSICIPTYNRCEYLDNTLANITSCDIFQNTDDIQIVISDNCSTDSTETVCKKYTENFPDKIKYVRQKETIFADENIFKTFEYADGVYCKLNNDTCRYKDGMLDKIVNYLKSNEEDCVFLFNKKVSSPNLKKVYTLDDFIQSVSYNSTWIGALCIKKEIYKKLENPLECIKLKLPQVDIYGKLFKKNFSVLIWENNFFEVESAYNKGSYNVAEIFCKNYFTILSKYVGENNGISIKTFDNEKSRPLLNHINELYFDWKRRYTFPNDGYFKYLFNYYWNKPYFYFAYIFNLLMAFLFLCVETKKERNTKYYKIFGFMKFSVQR